MAAAETPRLLVSRVSRSYRSLIYFLCLMFVNAFFRAADIAQQMLFVGQKPQVCAGVGHCTCQIFWARVTLFIYLSACINLFTLCHCTGSLFTLSDG